MNTQGINQSNCAAGFEEWVAAHPDSTTTDVHKAYPQLAYRTVHGHLTRLSKAGKLRSRQVLRNDRQQLAWSVGRPDDYVDPEEVDDEILTVRRSWCSSWRVDHPVAVRSVFDLASVSL